MTKEQAKEILWNRCQHTPETAEAIRVLSEERPKLTDEQIEQIIDLLENEWGYEGIREDVSRILTCNNLQGEWIPVSERLPNDRDWHLGLFKEPDTDFIGIPYICDYVGEVTKGTTNEGWILRHCTDVDNVPDYFRNLICVAWQPLPEPYREGEWIWLGDNANHKWSCNKCGRGVKEQENFCPNCGLKMQKGDAE